jgi:hypothetical protein
MPYKTKMKKLFKKNFIEKTYQSFKVARFRLEVEEALLLSLRLAWG